MMEITICCDGIETKAQLHALLADKLDFPDWYGHNLDALMDCLTDLDPTEVTLVGWQDLPFSAEGFWETFQDAETENPNLKVTFL